MYYVIHFRNSTGDKTKMAFKLQRSRAAKQFIHLVQDDIDHGRTVDPSDDYNFAMAYGRDTATNMASDLNKHIDAFNVIQMKELRFRIEHFKFSGNLLSDRQLLNQQHSDFEFFLNLMNEENTLVSRDSASRLALIESAGLGQRAAVAWNYPNHELQCKSHLNSINRLIHRLESCLPMYYSNSTSYLNAYIAYTVSNGSRVKNTREYHSCFTLGSEFGSLMMNYATRGKNLSNIYQDNDLIYLEEGGRCTPQSYINSGVLALFSGRADNRLSDDNSHSHQHRKAAFEHWFESNNIRRFGYEMDCDRNCLGFIPLGTYCPTDPFDMNSMLREIVDHYKDYPILSHYELTKTLES